jgi:cytochrome b6-f complex iron-sulfur subunit
MAKRPSVQEILELARRGGPAVPGGGSPEPEPGAATEPPAEPETEAAAESAAPAAAAAPAADIPTPEKLGRPLTVKEKLAAARAGGATKPAAAPAASKPAAAAAEGEAPPAAAKAVPPPAAPIGRPLTLAEKLAAARSGGSSPAPAAGGAAKPAGAKPAAAAKAAPAKPARELPPLDKISDPKDLAEALRQAGAKKEKEVAAATAAAKPAPAAKAARESKPATVLPRPTRAGLLARAASMPRRAFLTTTTMIWIGWGAFALGCLQFTAMMVRFMFPNVLAEPPSTIKVGPPTNFEPEAVNERFKAEWGFWIVRSTRYNGQDIIYAIQSVCTHLGCPPNWLAGEQKFKCPCHGSGFYISGVNFEGPAPRPLERFKVTLGDDGQLVVDKSQKFQEELGQWSDPDSFITA